MSSEASRPRHSPQFQMVRGFPFPNTIWFKKENIEQSLDYVPHDDDTIVASYPKTGTTWLQYIVVQILSKGVDFPDFNDLLYKLVPYIEMSGVEAVEALKEPRVFKHHIPYNMVKKNDRSKTLYTFRNPEDTVVSYYHFYKELVETKIDFNDFVDEFISGNIAYGRYFEHVLSFYEHKDDGNLLMISYEKMQADRRGWILKIAKFLGEQHYQCVKENDSIMEKILEHTSFEYMKRNLKLVLPKEPAPGQEASGNQEQTTTVNFFRKGIVGDGKNTLSVDQRLRIREKAEEIMRGTEILKEWYNE